MKSGRKSFMRLAASTVAAVILGFFASCGEVTTTPLVTEVQIPTQPEVQNPTQPEVQNPTPPPATGGNSFTVTPGDYQRVQVTRPGKISFTVVGIDMDLDKDAWPIVYFYDSHGYTGGRGGSGGFNGELRTYKLKYYDAYGTIASESYYVQPNGSTPPWSSTVARNVSLEWGPDFVMSTVDGIQFRKPGSVPSTFTLGIGYPPEVRPGWDGAVYTNIVWPTGSTAIE